MQLTPQMTCRFSLKFGKRDVDKTALASLTTNSHKTEFDLLEVADHTSDFVVNSPLTFDQVLGLLL